MILAAVKDAQLEPTLILFGEVEPIFLSCDRSDIEKLML